MLEEDKYIKVMNKNAGVRVISDSVFLCLKIYRKSTHLHLEIIYALKSNEESLQKKNAIVRFRFRRQALLQRLLFS